MREKPNSGTTGVIVSICIMIAGILMIVVPALVHMDGMNGGFALGFLGFFLTIIGFICYLMFRKRRKIRNRMLEGDIIARFVYGNEQWDGLAREEISGSSSLKIMGIVLGSIFGIIGIISVLADEDLVVFFLIMLAFAVFFSCLGFISSAVNKKRVMNCVPEAVITRDGVSYMGALYDWNGVTSVLDAVGFHPDKTDMLVFSYRQIAGRYARIHRSNLIIPVPAGMEETASMVVQFFNLPLWTDQISELKNEE